MVWMHPEPKGSFLGEGDTPTFLNLVDNGLRAWQNPEWGGWGGRMHPGGSGFSLFGPPPPTATADTSGVARGLAPAGSDVNKPGPLGNNPELICRTSTFPLYRPVPWPSMRASSLPPKTTLRRGAVVRQARSSAIRIIPRWSESKGRLRSRPVLAAPCSYRERFLIRIITL